MVCNWCCFYKRRSSGVNQVFAMHPYDFLFLYFWYLPSDDILHLQVHLQPSTVANDCRSRGGFNSALDSCWVLALPCNSCARQTSVCTFFAFSLSFCLLPLFPSSFIYHCVFFFFLLILQFTPWCPEPFPICTVYYYLHKGAITFGMIFWVGIFKGQSHISQVNFTSWSESVSEWVRIVSYWQGLQIGLGSDKNVHE